MAGVAHVTRRVSWATTVQRSTLRRAYELQGPQLILPLPGENGVCAGLVVDPGEDVGGVAGTLAGGLAVGDEPGGHPHEPAPSDF